MCVCARVCVRACVCVWMCYIGGSHHLWDLHSGDADVLSARARVGPVHKLLPEQCCLIPLKQTTQQGPARAPNTLSGQKKTVILQNMYLNNLNGKQTCI